MVADVLTVGHSNRDIEIFAEMLRANAVKCVVDVRTVPRSRHNPQFNRENLPESPALDGIAYEHLSALGGLRHPRKDSINAGWRNESFRGYADYMQTAEFEAGLETLMEITRREMTAIMCAEAVPWRCHRSLIADALTVRGLQVGHIMSTATTQIHSLTPFAAIDGVRITYPREQNAI